MDVVRSSEDDKAPLFQILLSLLRALCRQRTGAVGDVTLRFTNSGRVALRSSLRTVGTFLIRFLTFPYSYSYSYSTRSVDLQPIIHSVKTLNSLGHPSV